MRQNLKRCIPKVYACEKPVEVYPNSIERWDRDYIAPHLAVLQALMHQAPAYRLLLAPDVPALPELIGTLV